MSYYRHDKWFLNVLIYQNNNIEKNRLNFEYFDRIV